MTHLATGLRLGIVLACGTACSEQATTAATAAAPETRSGATEQARKPSPAPALRWKRHTLTFNNRGYRDAPELRVSVRSGSAEEPVRLSFRWFDFPAHSSVAFGGEEVATEHGSGSFEVALPDLAEIRIVDLDRTELELAKTPLTIKLRGHEPATTQLPKLGLRGVLPIVLKQVIDRPIRFPGEQPDDRLDTVALLAGPMKILGKGKVLGDLDWIAIAEHRPTGKTRTCSGYTGKHPTVEVEYHEQHVAIRDRRTAAVVAETTLAPPKACPRFALVGKDGKGTQYPRRGAAEAWVRGVLARHQRGG